MIYQVKVREVVSAPLYHGKAPTLTWGVTHSIMGIVPNEAVVI